MTSFEETLLRMETNPVAAGFPLNIDDDTEYHLRVLPDGTLYISLICPETQKQEHITWAEAASIKIDGRSLQSWALEAQCDLMSLGSQLRKFSPARHEVIRVATNISIEAADDAVENKYLERYDDIEDLKDTAEEFEDEFEDELEDETEIADPIGD